MIITKHTAGLTLIEMMVVIAIIGLLAGIAWPLYDGTQIRSRRSDAIMALTRAQAEMERCYSRNGTYTGCAPANANSPQNYYAITVTLTNDNTLPLAKQGVAYVLTAAPVAGTAQAGDSDCATITINNAGQKSGTNTSCWPS